MARISDEVRRTFSTIVEHLGPAFSFEELAAYAEGCRGKPLRFEQERMPATLGGWCIALQDVDLICTRVGMDDLLTQTVRLHEIAHLLLHHVLHLADGPATPTYQEFQRRRRPVFRHHFTMYADPLEQDAETLATLLLDGIRQEESALPDLAKEVHGWTDR